MKSSMNDSCKGRGKVSSTSGLLCSLSGIRHKSRKTYWVLECTNFHTHLCILHSNLKRLFHLQDSGKQEQEIWSLQLPNPSEKDHQAEFWEGKNFGEEGILLRSWHLEYKDIKCFSITTQHGFYLNFTDNKHHPTKLWSSLRKNRNWFNTWKLQLHERSLLSTYRLLLLMQQSERATLQLQIEFSKNMISLCKGIHARSICSRIKKFICT